MEISIKIDEQRITELVEQMVAEELVSEHYNKITRDTAMGMRDGTDKAIQKYIYSRKDDIIERVVERATREITKKGLPKMLERLGKIDE